MRVVGVDPGLAATGYAVIEVGTAAPLLRATGCARTAPRQRLESRILSIYDHMSEVLGLWEPELAVMEGVYADYGFPRTAILMGHVRGAICLSAAQHGARVLEISPAEVKSALTGSGRAAKEQIQRAVTRVLRLDAPPANEHVGDALALALVGATREGARLF